MAAIKTGHQMCVKAPLQEIRVHGSLVEGEREDSACPLRSLERFTAGPQMCVSLEACLSGCSL